MADRFLSAIVGDPDRLGLVGLQPIFELARRHVHELAKLVIGRLICVA